MDDLDTRTDAPSSRPTDEALGHLSLIQALRDFEVANGRVVDLTERLVITAEELLEARQELDAVRAERDELRTRLEELSARYDALHETHQRTLERKSVKVGEAIWAASRSIPVRRRVG